MCNVRYLHLFRCLWKRERRIYEDNVNRKIREYCFGGGVSGGRGASGVSANYGIGILGGGSLANGARGSVDNSYFRMLAEDHEARMRMPALDSLIQFVGHSKDTRGLEPTTDLEAALTQYYSGVDDSKVAMVSKMAAALGDTPKGRQAIMTKLFDVYGVVPAFVETAQLTDVSSVSLPSSPSTRGEWWFSIVRKQLAEFFELTLTPSPPLLQMSSRVSFLRSDLAASYHLYQFPGLKKGRTLAVALTPRSGADSSTSSSARPDVDSFFSGMLRRLFTHQDLKDEHLIQAHDFVLGVIADYGGATQGHRHPWFVADPDADGLEGSSGEGRAGASRQPGFRRRARAALAPVKVTLAQVTHQKEVLTNIQKADKKAVFIDRLKVPKDSALRKAFDAEVGQSSEIGRLDFHRIRARVESRAYDSTPGHCYMGVYRDLEIMCLTAIRFYGSRLQFFVERLSTQVESRTGFSSELSGRASDPTADGMTKIPDHLVDYLESIQTVVQAINVAKVAEPDSRSKADKSALYNLLPGPPLDLEDRSARMLWNYVRSLRSCDPFGAFHRPPPIDLFGGDTDAMDAYPESFDKIMSEVDAFVVAAGASDIAGKPATASDDKLKTTIARISWRAKAMLEKYIAWCTAKLKLNRPSASGDAEASHDLDSGNATPEQGLAWMRDYAAAVLTRVQSEIDRKNKRRGSVVSLTAAPSEGAEVSESGSEANRMTVQMVIEELRTRCPKPMQKFFFEPVNSRTYGAEKGVYFQKQHQRMFPSPPSFRTILDKATKGSAYESASNDALSRLCSGWQRKVLHCPFAV